MDRPGVSRIISLEIPRPRSSARCSPASRGDRVARRVDTPRIAGCDFVTASVTIARGLLSCDAFGPRSMAAVIVQAARTSSNLFPAGSPSACPIHTKSPDCHRCPTLRLHRHNCERLRRGAISLAVASTISRCPKLSPSCRSWIASALIVAASQVVLLVIGDFNRIQRAQAAQVSRRLESACGARNWPRLHAETASGRRDSRLSASAHARSRSHARRAVVEPAPAHRTASSGRRAAPTIDVRVRAHGSCSADRGRSC